MTHVFDSIDSHVNRFFTPARRRHLHRPSTLLWAFIGLHAIFFTALAPLMLTGGVLGDLPLYRYWAEMGFNNGLWQGIDTPWVYPIGAMLPIAAADLGGPYLYQFLWFLMTCLLNAAAVAVLTDVGRRASGYRAAWWFLTFTFLLSPVGLLRLEGLTAPIVVIALALIARRPVVATLLLSLATWIKVWPAAIVLSVLVASRRRFTVLLTGAAFSVALALGVWLLGGARMLTSFVTMQSDRALQLEAPVSTPWVWMAALGQRDTEVYQNFAIATREIRGPGAEATAALMTPLMFVAVAAIFVLMLVALGRRRNSSELVLCGSLALVSAFVVFNKVGSPQYMLWLVPVVVVGITHGWARWRVPAYLMLFISGLTTLVFPVFYLPLIAGNLMSVTLLTMRNGLLVLLFGIAVLRLVQLARTPRTVLSRVEAATDAGTAAATDPATRFTRRIIAP